MLTSTIRRLITYVPTHTFMSECRLLRALFPDTNMDHRNADCDSCHCHIGGPRLFCLDCSIKSTGYYDSVDLCCAPQCIGARVTRYNIEGAHEPSHRLVKARINVVTRSHGRVHTAACKAFEHVGETCKKIAEFTSRPDEETEPDERETLSPGPASTKTPARSDKPDGVLNPLDGTKGGAEAKSARWDRVKDQSLPTCGKCKGCLSFPFWYCIFCEGRFPRMTLFAYAC